MTKTGRCLILAILHDIEGDEHHAGCNYNQISQQQKKSWRHDYREWWERMTRRLWLSSRCIMIIIIVASVVIIINVRNVHFTSPISIYLSEGNQGWVCCGSQRGGSLLLFKMMTGLMEQMMEMMMEIILKWMNNAENEDDHSNICRWACQMPLTL